MKYSTVTDVLNYAFAQVACSFNQRYPNKHSKHVVSEDILLREITKDEIKSVKLIFKKSNMPKWFAHRFNLNVHQVAIVEESVINRATQTITTYTRNIGLTEVSKMEERCIYSGHDESRPSSSAGNEAHSDVNNVLPHKTNVLKEAWFESKMKWGVGSMVERYLQLTYVNVRASGSTKGLREVIELLNKTNCGAIRPKTIEHLTEQTLQQAKRSFEKSKQIIAKEST